MVVLNKIYTKTGDKGETALGNGDRVAKHALRVTSYGTVDETNATVGLARLHATGDIDTQLAMIQNDLFDLGADLCRPDMETHGVTPRRAFGGGIGIRGNGEPRRGQISEPFVGLVLPSGSHRQ